MSQELVTMLGLKTEKLTKPYCLAWFKEGSEVPIMTKYLVHFSIGKNYEDIVWCNVASLGECHTY